MSDMAIDYTRRPISVQELDRMFEAGVLDPGERVELIEGELVVKPPDTRRHRTAAIRLTRLFTARFNFRAVVQIQLSVVFEPYSAPHPDLALLIEDADTSRSFDRRRKLPLYARYRVRELWLVDVVDRTISIHREPRESFYSASTIAVPGDRVACAAFPNDFIDVNEILGAESTEDRSG